MLMRRSGTGETQAAKYILDSKFIRSLEDRSAELTRLQARQTDYLTKLMVTTV
jgi:hypothetical protein